MSFQTKFPGGTAREETNTSLYANRYPFLLHLPKNGYLYYVPIPLPSRILEYGGNLPMAPVSYSVSTKQLSDTLNFEQTPILSYDIKYPCFEPVCEAPNAGLLNEYYSEKALILEDYVRKNLYPMAVQQYQFAKENQYPVMEYQVVQDFTVTYNQDRLLSLYYDQYAFTGGAHGNTDRYSNVWDTEKETTLTLKEFFPHNPNYKHDIIEAINTYICKEKAAGDSTYFDDYKQNVAKEFNENNFYLLPEGIVIYFQQYQIAPYSSGIPQFLIPFQK